MEDTPTTTPPTTPKLHYDLDNEEDLDAPDSNYNDNDVYQDNFADRQQNDQQRTKPTLKMRHLFEIPVHELPCPQEDHGTESPQTFIQTPAYAEINFNRSTKQSAVVSLILFLLFVCMT